MSLVSLQQLDSSLHKSWGNNDAEWSKFQRGASSSMLSWAGSDIAFLRYRYAANFKKGISKHEH